MTTSASHLILKMNVTKLHHLHCPHLLHLLHHPHLLHLPCLHRPKMNSLPGSYVIAHALSLHLAWSLPILVHMDDTLPIRQMPVSGNRCMLCWPPGRPMTLV